MPKLAWGGALLAALLAGPALAADMPVRAPSYPVYRPPPTPAVVDIWTGCYVGAAAGWAWGRSRHEALTTSITEYISIDGGLAGGTVGCNYQWGMWVAGVEGDWSWANKKGDGPDLIPFPPISRISETRETWLATARARLGLAPDDRWLIYITGGYAAANVQARLTNTLGLDVVDSKVRSGWVGGLGVEWFFCCNMTAKAEYLYVGLEDASYFDAPPLTVIPRSNVLIDNHILRAGINFKLF